MKTLFTRMLAFALICAVACNVGCKNYDDDIAAVNNRIDELQETVVLKTDFEALKSTVNALASSCVSKEELAEALKPYAKTSDVTAMLNNAQQALDDAIADIEDAIVDLQNASSKHQTSEQVAATVESMLQSYKTWADTEAYIEAQIEAIVTGLTEAEVNALLAAYVKTADLHEAILGWTGDELKNFLTAEALEAYVTDEALVEALEKYLTAEDIADFLTAEAVKALIAEADNSETLKQEIIDAMTGEEGTVTIAVKDLNAAIEALTKRVENLENKSKIQSIVWVPSTLAEVENGTVTFAGATYLPMTGVDENGSPVVTNVYATAATKTLKFKVTPAAAAKDITAENLTIDMQKVTRNTPAELFSIVSVNGSENGMLAVELKVNDFDAVYAMSECPIISLNVAANEAENCASNYVAIAVEPEALATAVYGNLNDDDAIVEIEQIDLLDASIFYNGESIIGLPWGDVFVNGNALPEGWSYSVEAEYSAVDSAAAPVDATLFTSGNTENEGYWFNPNSAKEVIGGEVVGTYTVSIVTSAGSYEVATYTKNIDVYASPAAGNLKTVAEAYMITNIFDGTNHSFTSEITFQQIKEDLWALNKEVWEPYGYDATTFGAMLGFDDTYTVDKTQSAYNLNLGNSGGAVRVSCGDVAAMEWVGKGPQNLTMTFKSTTNCPDAVEETLAIPFVVELKMPEITLVPNANYVVDGIATAYAKWDSNAYVVYDKTLSPAYYYESTEAEDVVLVYSIAEDLTGFTGDAPEIVSDVLEWNDWNSLSIKVKVAACYDANRDVELASATFYVQIASPIGALTAVNKEVASANPADVVIADLFSVAMAGEGAVASTNILADSILMDAVDGEFDYTVNIPASAASIVTYDEANGKLTFVDPALQLQNDITIEIVATFSDRFTGEEQTATSVVTLKK